MTEIFFLQAECGDAAYIYFEDAAGTGRHMLIDAGYERTYAHILRDTIDRARQIDAFVISHIHDDHIGGAIAYLKAVERGETIDKVVHWLYNPPRPRTIVMLPSPAISTAASIEQGDRLAAYLKKIGKLPEQDVGTNAGVMNIHGLQLHWLSPTPQKLQHLRSKYADPAVPLEKEESPVISNASGAGGDDYTTRIEDFKLTSWKQDANIENGSSIAFYTDLDGFKVLWLADAHPRVIVQSLKNLGHTLKNRFKCEIVKLTHHASKGNNSDAMFDLIDCRRYVISANGENKHFLPSKESLARLLRNKHRDVQKEHFELHFTYDNATLRRIFEVDGNGVFDRWNFSLHFVKPGENAIKLQVPSSVYKRLSW
ncbi:MAG TPA: MBL fold metallo-hydrolase [Mucilaginibacter sp.]|nr:MBL fold metallo-hydrolase [Mucilaginibacter sp.]